MFPLSSLHNSHEICVPPNYERNSENDHMNSALSSLLFNCDPNGTSLMSSVQHGKHHFGSDDSERSHSTSPIVCPTSFNQNPLSLISSGSIIPLESDTDNDNISSIISPTYQTSKLSLIMWSRTLTWRILFLFRFSIHNRIASKSIQFVPWCNHKTAQFCMSSK